ncbi:glutamyl-tRNA reductase [Anaeromyxobacter diazotrophicus]|uniref:Glutamyl-tRNA reductase n=1 Tax=Anaeromyxobacter diazotrophicus TaxID=2590199 RepID=A0A7I9VPB1_9BACT|nr:glutamyl-tRNA reductase [Anaeromyxobacter diazotrophicus]GEJ58243.1 glutamyl-tRNA reductase [Anaeromyxobacter diazotrophicus]
MLIAVGLNQKGATVADRERLAVRAEEMANVIQGYAALGGVDELVLLSTCYRLEIYAATRCPSAAAVALRRALSERAGGAEVPLFELHGDDALRHMLRVASSLESAVLGEPQILGQVKEAHARATEAGVLGRELNGVLHRVFEVAKRVRTETAIGRAGVSWGNAAAALAEKVLGTVRGRRVLVLGAGEMARLSAQHLREQGAEVVVVNRTLANAEALAAEVGGTARPLEALDEELLLADVVVSAAPAAPAAFAPAALRATVKARRRRDLVMVDLAVPRAIPAESGAIDGVWLCDVDDLARLTQRALADRTQAVADAERVIEEELARFRRDQAERKAAPIIQAMRQHAASIAREEVDRTVKRLGADAEIERRLDAMANAVVSKLLHAPSTRLRRAGVDGPGGERLMAAAVEIFGLPLDGAPPAAR